MVSSKSRPAYMSPYTTGSSGWADPFEKSWDWLDIADMSSWRWAADAACAGTDPEIFFSTPADTPVSVLTAVCSACPVRAQCLEYALLNDEYGWWGGTTRTERRKLIGET